MEPKLKILEAKSKQYLRRFQNAYDLIGHSETDREYNLFLKRTELLEETRLTLLQITDEINELNLKLNPKFEPDYGIIETIDDMACEIEFEKKRILSILQEKSPSSPNKLFIKLPKLELRSFSGDLKEWPAFYETFKKTIHENNEISDAVKIQYLIGKLTGRALNAISGIPPIESNYKIIWEALTDRYEDKGKLALSYVSRMFQFSPIKSESVGQLEFFLENFVTAYDALKQIGIVDLADFIVLYLASTKVDRETFKNFEMLDNIRGKDYPTFAEFVKFLKEQIKILGRGHAPGSFTQKFPRISKSFFVENKSFSESKCPLCQSEVHPLYACNKFKNMSVWDRQKWVRNQHRCFNCLSHLHQSPACKSSHTCGRCHKKHHTLLHFNKESKETEKGSKDSLVTPAKTVLYSVEIPPSAEKRTVLLSTAVVNIYDSFERPHRVRVLIDSGSQANLITFKCLKKLGLSQNKLASSVKGISSVSQPVRGCCTLKISPLSNKNQFFEVKSLVVNHITDKLPSSIIDVSSMECFRNLFLADEQFYKPAEIEAIFGAALFSQILGSKVVKGENGDISALETSLGYIIMGSAPLKPLSSDVHSFCVFKDPPLETLVQKFWELEDVELAKDPSPDDTLCEHLFKSSVNRDKLGKYFVDLPFKDDPKLLGDSFNIARHRLLSLEKKLSSMPDLRQKYNNAMKKYVDEGYMYEIDSVPRSDAYYIPHHGVYKKSSSSTPLRIVFDASCKTSNGKSLNDILYAGPKLQSDIFDVLLNFRLFAVAITADIKQMYLRIGVNQPHRKYQRLLWRFAPSESIRTFELSTVTFGITSSPFLALRVIKQLVQDEGHNHPQASEVVLRDMYIDDLATSFKNVAEGKVLFEDLISLFKKGNFELVKWSSNSKELLDFIPAEMRLTEQVSFDSSNFLKILGLNWQPENDYFNFNVDHISIDKKYTKRTLLSVIARIFDPLGFLSCVTVFAKILMKRLWMMKVDWDEPLPESIQPSWDKFISELPCLAKFCVPRYLHVHENTPIDVIGFCDASLEAYGAVVYLRTRNLEKSVECLLITAKSKVTPLKPLLTIPRLELCSATLLSKLLQRVLVVLKNRISIENVMAFTDSMIALGWIQSSPQRWKPFIANRISQIHEKVPEAKWYHVAGAQNPADSISRSVRPSELLNHPLWLHGPPWLKNDKKSWPIESFEGELDEENLKEERARVVLINIIPDDVITNLSHRCSSWLKLVRIVSYLLRICKRYKPSSLILETSELLCAEKYIWKFVQKKYFAPEIEAMERGHLPSAKFRSLSLFMHEGLLRVGGRLANSSLKFESRHPILLPKEERTVTLLVDHFHRSNLHSGPALVHSLLRQNYWILSGRGLVRSRIRLCNTCFRCKPVAPTPFMANLPASRVSELKPFLHVGVDYGGPFSITISRHRGARTQKCYICLFVCLSTKGVHLELASDLSTTAFLKCFRRFIARRGPVGIIYSDQGTNFVGAKNELELIQSDEFKTLIGNELSTHKIEWRFNPPAAPHFGGIWEANIKSVKTHLYRVIGSQILTYEEFYTLLTQVEALLNSRPLTWLSPDPNDPEPLTPAHFLTLTPLRYLPIPATDPGQGSPNRKFLIDQLTRSYWDRWRNEYLHTLQGRLKWTTPSKPVERGTLVLLQDNSPPLQWPRGVIKEIFPGKDGIVRVAEVKTASGVVKRPVVKLCPLPSQ